MINNDDTALMPCSCGRTNGLTSVKMFEYSYSSHPFYVACTCGMRTQDCKSEKEAREIWNTRPTPQNTPAPDDLLKFGVLFEKDGKRIDPREVYIAPQNAEAMEALNNLMGIALDTDADDPAYSNGDVIIDLSKTIRAALQSPARPYIAKEDGSIEQLSARPVVKPLEDAILQYIAMHRDQPRQDPITTQEKREQAYVDGWNEALDRAVIVLQAKIGECLG